MSRAVEASPSKHRHTPPVIMIKHCVDCGCILANKSLHELTEKMAICSTSGEVFDECTHSEIAGHHCVEDIVYLCSRCTHKRPMSESDIQIYYNPASEQFRNWIAKRLDY